MQVVPHEGGCVICLAGVIGDTFDRGDLVRAAKGVVIFDLAGVHRITSYGVREWMSALREMQATYYGFLHCRPALVSQFNMVANFGVAGQLISFYLPYVCAECDESFDVLVDLRNRYDIVVSGDPPAAVCPHCQGAGEFDDLADMYFAYMSAHPQPTVPALASRIIDGNATDAVERSRVQKEVEPDLTAIWLSGPLTPKLRLRRLVDGLSGTVVVLGGGLTEIRPDATKPLLAFAALENADVFLARMPLALAEQIWAASPALDSMGLVSVVAEGTCPTCSAASTVEIDPKGMLATCRTCGPVAPQVDKNLVVSIREKLVTEMPPSVSVYLSSRPGSSLSTEELSFSDSSSGSLTGIAEQANDGAPSQYEIVRHLSTGGMGEVFLARRKGPEGFEKLVVLKRIIGHRADKPEFVEMFLREARLAARLSHPNVVTTFDLGQEKGGYYIAMEYVRGWDLRAVLKTLKAQSRTMPIPIACRIVSDVCAGLHAAHTYTDDDGTAAGIIHRDISPGNVLISSTGVVKVTDFGVARGAQQQAEPITDPGVLKGKVPYLAPEVIMAKDDHVGASADVYSTGIVLFECLTRSHPFRRDTNYATLNAILADDRPALQRLRAESPAELQRIVDRALAHDVERRYRTALEFRIDLDKFLSTSDQAVGAHDLASWLDDLMQGETSPTLRPSNTPNREDETQDGTSAPGDNRLQRAIEQLEGAGKRLDRILEQRRKRKP